MVRVRARRRSSGNSPVGSNGAESAGGECRRTSPCRRCCARSVAAQRFHGGRIGGPVAQCRTARAASAAARRSPARATGGPSAGGPRPIRPAPGRGTRRECREPSRASPPSRGDAFHCRDQLFIAAGPLVGGFGLHELRTRRKDRPERLSPAAISTERSTSHQAGVAATFGVVGSVIPAVARAWRFRRRFRILIRANRRPGWR